MSLKAKHFISIGSLHFVVSKGSPALGLNEYSSGGPTVDTRDLALIFVSDEILVTILYFPNYLIKLFHTKATRQVKNSQSLVPVAVTILKPMLMSFSFAIKDLLCTEDKKPFLLLSYG